MPRALSVSPVSRSSAPPSGPEFPRTGRASPTVSCCRTAALRRAARPAPSSARRLPRSKRSASPGPAGTTRSAFTAIPQAWATSRRRFARRSAKPASRPRPWRVELGRGPRAQARPDASAGRRCQPGRPPVGIGGRGLADRNSVHVRAHRIVSGAGSRAAIRRRRRRGDHGRHRLAVGLLPRVLVDRPARGWTLSLLAATLAFAAVTALLAVVLLPALELFVVMIVLLVVSLFFMPTHSARNDQ